MIPPRKIILAFLFLIFVYPKVISQENRIPISIKFGIQNINQEVSQSTVSEISLPMPSIAGRINVSYRHKNIDFQPYFAFSTVKHWLEMNPFSDTNYPYLKYALLRPDGTLFIGSSTNNLFLPSKTLVYGLSVNYQLLPFITKKERLRFEFYVIGEVGAVSAKWSTFDGKNDYIETWNKPVLEYGMGLGTSYILSKHFSLYGEYTMGKYYNKGNSLLRGGITFKL